MAATTATRILRSIPVGRQASEPLKASVPAGNVKTFCREYLRLLAGPAKKLRKLQGEDSAALWSIEDAALSPRERSLAAGIQLFWQSIRTGRQKARQRRALETLLAEWASSFRQAPRPWESVAVAELLLLHGESLEPATFSACIAVLARLKSELSGSAAAESAPPLQEMMAGIGGSEATCIVALLLSPLGDSEALLESGCSELRQLVQQATDEAGCPHGSLLPVLARFLNAIARPVAWAAAFRQSVWTQELHSRLNGLTAAAAMLVMPPQPAKADDTPYCSPSLADPLLLLTAGLRHPHTTRLQKLLLKSQRPLKKIRAIKPWKSAPETERPSGSGDKSGEEIATPSIQPAWQSDSACCAVLRSSLDHDADLISVDWHAEQVQLQVYTGGVLLFSGVWHWSARTDESQAATPVAWKCSCWFDDPECVFIELEGEPSGTLKCVRQIMLARRDRFAVFTDTVSTLADQVRVQLTTALPFAASVAAVADTVTRELRLSRGVADVRTLPLWLEDDRLQHPAGSCAVHDGQLEMTAPGAGGVTVPVAFDWNPRRSDVPADWARLTVTENRRRCGSHEAAGFRVRVGKFQVLLYRSLMAGASSRAVLGLHTWDETVYTRVPGRETPMEGLVEVESPG